MRFENATRSDEATAGGWEVGGEGEGVLKENGVALSNLKSFFYKLSLRDPLFYCSHRRIKDAIEGSIWRIRRYEAK